MARLKKLNLPKDVSGYKTSSENILLDKKDNILAKEHLGLYIPYESKTGKNWTTKRLYLSLEAQLDHYDKRKARGIQVCGARPSACNQHLLDLYPNKKTLIKEYIALVAKGASSYASVKSSVSGCRIFLTCMKSAKLQISSIDEISSTAQTAIYKEFSSMPCTRTDETELRRFFGILEKNLPYFTAIVHPYRNEGNSLEAISSSVAFQLDYHAQADMNEIMKKVEKYNKIKEEAKHHYIFSLENLAKTYYDLRMGEGQKARGQAHVIIDKLCQKLYGIELRPWYGIGHGGRKIGRTKKQEKMNQHLLDLSKKGINIDIKDEEMFLRWHSELIPNYPFDENLDPKYSGIYGSAKIFRTLYREKVGGNSILREVDRYIYPTVHTIYPLILFLMLREGINSDQLRSWKIKKSKNGEYTVGDSSSIALLIDGVKGRSNSVLTTVISNESDAKKYIDFYIKWMTPIYERSSDNDFFQYLCPTCEKDKLLKTWEKTLLTTVSKFNPDSFYYRHTILDDDENRVKKINHKRIRPYSNYADYLRDYSEFERQYRKGHKSINTQIHYENSAEWKADKSHKIAKAQNLAIGIFRGEINRDQHPMAELFAGIIADCKDNRNPTYEGSTKLKDNEVCGDWFKCLSKCEKSVVLPKIHAPKICAWIEYMEKERKEYYRDEDWEKEYKMDYDSANSVFEGFTKEEKEYAEANAHKYAWIMGKRFKKRLKIDKGQECKTATI